MPTTQLIDSKGVRRDVDDADLAGALQAGWRLPTAADDSRLSSETAQDVNYGGIRGGIGAVGAGLARGLTLGGTDIAARLFADEDTVRTLQGLRQENPGLSTGSELVGAIAPALVGAGAGSVGRALARTPAGAVTRIGEAGFAGGLADVAIGTGIEGAAQSAGSYLSDVALTDRELSAEGLGGALGLGFGFGAAGGAAALGIQKGAISARRLLSKSETTDQAAQLAEADWTRAAADARETYDSAAEVARREVARARSAAQTAAGAEPTPGQMADALSGVPPVAPQQAEKLEPLLREYDDARAALDLTEREIDDLERSLTGMRTPEVQVGGPAGYQRPPWSLDETPGMAAPTPASDTQLGLLAQGTPVGRAGPSTDAATAVGRRAAPLSDDVAADLRSAGFTSDEIRGISSAEADSALKWHPDAPANQLGRMTEPTTAVGRPTVPSSANAGSSLEDLLAGTKSRLDAGESLSDIGAGAPARRGYVTGKELDTGRPLTQSPPSAQAIRDEDQALFWYQNGRGTAINDFARTGKLYEGSTLPSVEEAKKTVEAIDRAIERGVTNADQVVYRGIGSGSRGAERNIVGELKPGSIIEDPGYSSTTTSRRVAFDYTNKPGSTMLEIELPKGSKHAVMDDDGLGEAEILLPRGSKFEVLSVRNETIDGRNVRIGRVRALPAGSSASEFSVDHKFLGPTPMRLTSETRTVGGNKITEIKVFRQSESGEPMFVGEARFTHQNGKLLPDEVTVDGPFQRLGIGTKMYQAAEGNTGLKVAPGKQQTEAGKAFSAKYRGETTTPTPQPMSKSDFDDFKRKYKNASSDKDFAAGIWYSKDGDVIMNGVLRRGEVPTGRAAKGIEDLDAAINKPEAVLPVDTELYRGLSGKWAKENFAPMKPGDEFQDLAYTSTATNADSKVRNEEVVFLIHAPAGTRGAPIPSQFSSESELLLARGGKFRVDSNEIKPSIPNESRWKGAKSWDVHPDKSITIKFENGQSHTYPPYRELRVTLLNNIADPSVAKSANKALESIGVDSPVDQLSLKQIGEFQDVLNKKLKGDLDKPERDRLNKLWDIAVDRRIAIKDGKIADPPDWVPGSNAPDLPDETGLEGIARLQRTIVADELPAETGLESLARMQRGALTAAERAPAAQGGDLTELLAGTKQALDSGRSLRDVLAGLPDETGLEGLARVQRAAGLEDITRMADAVTRLEKASADLVEALGPAAPPRAVEATKVFRKAESEADRRMSERAVRALDDHVEPPPTTKRGRRKSPDATTVDQAPAGAMEGAIAAGRRRDEAAAMAALRGLDGPAPAASAAVTGAAPVGRLASMAADAGAALEVADTIGIPGLPRPGDVPVVGPLLSVYLKYRAIKRAWNWRTGRGSDRIAATGNARAAAMVAKVKDRVVDAVDRSLAAAAAAAPKARAIAAVSGGKLGEALAQRAFDDGEPDAPPDASTQAKAAVRIRELAAAVADPTLVSRKVRQELRDVSDPDLIAAAEAHRLALYQHLNDKAPKAPPPNPYSRREWEPPLASAMQLARRLQVANDPTVALDALATQTLTPEAAETFRIAYPKLAAFAQARLMEQAERLDRPVPYRQRLQNSLLFQIPLDDSMQPEHASVLATAHAPMPQAQPQQPTAPPTPGLASPTNITQLYQTTSDRRAMR